MLFTVEEFKKMTMEQLEERAAQIAVETAEADEAALEELTKELDAIEERKAQIKEEAEARQADIDAVVAGEGNVIAKPETRKEKKNMEIRNSQEYLEAFANYVKTGDDTECRALLSENSGVGVPVPELVESRIRTAWEKDEIMNRISKTYLKGNVKIGFEISGTDAIIHEEGANAPAEEELTLGVVSLIPQTIKKWISVSDEVMAMSGAEFLEYIYDEIAYKIVKKAADIIVAKIAAYADDNSDDTPAVGKIAAAPSATTIAQAEALLSDEAINPVVIMNKQTWGAFKALTTLDGYPLANPFDGLDVLFNNSLKTYAAANVGDVYAIVGSLETGARANFPNGEEVSFIFDELSLAEKDLVKIVGKMYAAIDVVAPGRFTAITKPQA